jgi:hypothetical protein
MTRMFDPTRRNEHLSNWFGNSLFSGLGDPRWFEQRAAWEQPPPRAADPIVTTPRDAWWRRAFRLLRRIRP